MEGVRARLSVGEHRGRSVLRLRWREGPDIVHTIEVSVPHSDVQAIGWGLGDVWNMGKRIVNEVADGPVGDFIKSAATEGILPAQARALGLGSLVDKAKDLLPMAAALPPPYGPAAMAAMAALEGGEALTRAAQAGQAGDMQTLVAALGQALQAQERLRGIPGADPDMGARVYRMMVVPA